MALFLCIFNEINHIVQNGLRLCFCEFRNYQPLCPHTCLARSGVNRNGVGLDQIVYTWMHPSIHPTGDEIIWLAAAIFWCFHRNKAYDTLKYVLRLNEQKTTGWNWYGLICCVLLEGLMPKVYCNQGSVWIILFWIEFSGVRYTYTDSESEVNIIYFCIPINTKNWIKSRI